MLFQSENFDFQCTCTFTAADVLISCGSKKYKAEDVKHMFDVLEKGETIPSTNIIIMSAA